MRRVRGLIERSLARLGLVALLVIVVLAAVLVLVALHGILDLAEASGILCLVFVAVAWLATIGLASAASGTLVRFRAAPRAPPGSRVRPPFAFPGSLAPLRL